MRIIDWSSDVCSSDLAGRRCELLPLDLLVAAVRLGRKLGFQRRKHLVSVDYRSGKIDAGAGMQVLGLSQFQREMCIAHRPAAFSVGASDRKSTRLNSSH